MAFKYRSPSVKIGGVRIRKNKKGFSVSSKTLTGGRKTYNTHTGKTTRTYKTGIKGLSYTTTTGGYKKTSRPVNRSTRKVSNTTSQTGSGGKGVIAIVIIVALALLKYILYLFPVALIAGGIYWYIKKKNSSQEDETLEDIDTTSSDGELNASDFIAEEATSEISPTEAELDVFEETEGEE